MTCQAERDARALVDTIIIHTHVTRFPTATQMKAARSFSFHSGVPQELRHKLTKIAHFNRENPHG